jgi:hypothetical protein
MTKHLQDYMMLQLVLLVQVQVMVLEMVLEMVLQEQVQVLDLHRNLVFRFEELIHIPNLLVDNHLHFLEQRMHLHKLLMLQKDR